MPEKKSKLKTGKKSKAHSQKLQEGFMEVYSDAGTSIIDAAKKMGTSYETAREYFLKCADIIAQANYNKNETWLDKRSRVIDRAMEGITKKKNEAVSSKIRMGSLLAVEYQKYKDLSKQGEELMADMKVLAKQIEQTVDPKTLKELFKAQKTLMREFQFGRETFTATVSQLAYLEKQFIEIQQFIVLLQEKYDVLDVMPPAVQILQAELEIYLDQKKESELRASTG